jgi:hypothetical protein
MAENNKQLEEAKKLLQEINILRGRLNQTPLKMTDSDAVQNIQSLRNELKGVQKSFEDVDTSATSLYDQVRAISSEFKNQPGALQRIRGSMKKITSIAEDLKLNEQGIKDLNLQQLDNLSQRLNENRKLLDDETERLLRGEDLTEAAQKDLKDLQEYLKTQGDVVNMTQQQRDEALEMVNIMGNLTAEQKAALSNYIDQGNAISLINEKIEEEKERQKEINKLMGVGGAIIGGASELMSKLGMNSGMFKQSIEDANKAMKDQAEKIQAGVASGGKLSVLMAGLGPLAKGFGAALLDPLSLILKIVDAFFKVDKASTDVQRLTGQNADAIAGANMRYATSVDYLETISELTRQTGMNAQNIFSPQVLAGAAELKNTMGLAADEAGGLAMIAQTTNGDIDATVDSIVDTTSAFNKANKSAVNQKQVLQDVAKASDGIKASLAGNPASIAKAASAARRLGMELGQLDKIASSLLDFEDSISKEMEAELLIGKDLNLEKARELALNNDLAGLGNELFKNAADINEFGNMNRIQQESYAAALGMTRDELGKIAYQKAIEAGMTEEQAEAAAGVRAEDMKRAEVQEQIQKSVDKLAQAFAPLLSIIGDVVGILAPAVQILGGIVGYVVKFLDTLGIIKPLIIGIVAVMAAGKIASFFGSATSGALKFAESMKGMKFSFSGMMDSVKSWGAGIKDAFKGGMSGAGKLADTAKSKVTDKAKDALADKAADQTGDLANKTKDAKGDGPGGFLKGLGDGLASIGKQFGDVVKGALALGIAGLALGGSFALALKMVQDVDPVTMLAFAGSIGIFGASLALVGKLGNDAIKGAIAMGIAGVALIPAAYAFSLMAGVDPMSVVALSGSLIALGIAAALMGNLGGQIIMGALALGILALALIPAAYAFSLLGSVDPMAVIAMTGSLIALGAAAALMGMTGPMVIAGALALGILALAMIPAAYAFSLLGSVDPMAITAMVGSLVVLGAAAALIGMTGPMVIAGAAAIGILALAMIPAAYAFSLLQGVDTASILAFSVALPLLAFATAGLGFVAPFIMAGAAALTVLGLALIPAASAFGIMAGADIQGVVDKLSMLASMGPGLIQAGIGLIATAGGLAVFAAALAGGSLMSGLTSLFTGGGIIEDLQNLTAMAGPLQSVAGSLTAIAAALGGIGAALATLETEKLEKMQGLIMTAAFAAPAVAAVGAIGDFVSGITGGGEEKGKSESNEKLIAKIDELIVAVKQGKNINMDGRKVGGTLQQVATNT